MLRLAALILITLNAPTLVEAAAPPAPAIQAPPAVPATLPGAQAAPAASTSTTTNPVWTITLNVQLDVSKVDRTNTSVGISCFAKPDLLKYLVADGITSGPVDAATYKRALQAHAIMNRDAFSSAPMANGEYHGLQSVSFSWPPTEALYKANGVQVDSMLVGCQLQLNNTPAILNPAAGLKVPGQSGPMFVTSGAVAFLEVRPIQWQPQ